MRIVSPDYLRRDESSRSLAVGDLMQLMAIAKCLSHPLKGLPLWFYQWFHRYLLIADCWVSGTLLAKVSYKLALPFHPSPPTYLWHFCCRLLPLVFFLFCFCLSLARSDRAISWSHRKDFFIQCVLTCWGFKVAELAVRAVCTAEPPSPYLN